MTEVITFREDSTAVLVNSMATDHMVTDAARISTATWHGMTGVHDSASDAGLIRYLMKNRHGCYDSATEVLTRTGWKAWPDVDGTEEFATLNLKTDEIEYQYATRLVRKPSEGPMIHVQANGVDLLVTPGHNMVASARTRGTSSSWDSPALVPAEQFMNRSYRLSSGGGDWKSGLIHAPEAAEILGFIVADGNVHGASISFNFGINTDKAAWIRHRWEHGFRELDGRVYLSRIPGDFLQLARDTYLEDGSRCFPQAILEEGDKTTLTRLLDGYLRGDGSLGASSKQTFSTTSRAVVDGVQELALKTGCGAVEAAPDVERKGAYGTKPVYRGTILRDRNSRPRIGWTTADRAREVTTEEYFGNIHCVTVPNGTLYVRRNGKPVWSGNTPFEHNAFTFRIECPIFVAREFMRHRIASYNEESGRYKKLNAVFWVPAPARPLIQEGKPGHYVMKPGTMEQYNFAVANLEAAARACYRHYEAMLNFGICREVARAALTVGVYTSFYVTMNARGLMNFLSLRIDDPTAAYPSKPQYEIEQAARQMEDEFAKKMPQTYIAFIESGRVAP